MFHKPTGKVGKQHELEFYLGYLGDPSYTLVPLQGRNNCLLFRHQAIEV